MHLIRPLDLYKRHRPAVALYYDMTDVLASDCNDLRFQIAMGKDRCQAGITSAGFRDNFKKKCPLKNHVMAWFSIGHVIFRWALIVNVI